MAFTIGEYQAALQAAAARSQQANHDRAAGDRAYSNNLTTAIRVAHSAHPSVVVGEAAGHAYQFARSNPELVSAAARAAAAYFFPPAATVVS